MSYTSISVVVLVAMIFAADAALPHRGVSEPMETESQFQNVVVPANAYQLPGVKTLELLRSTPLHDMEACATKNMCSASLTGLLADFSSHRGAIELIDTMVANFCLKSKHQHKMPFCRSHDYHAVKPDVHDHKDSEYKNIDVIHCMLDMPQCMPTVREHLDALLNDQETIRTLSAILKYICRVKHVRYTGELLACQAAQVGKFSNRNYP